MRREWTFENLEVDKDLNDPDFRYDCLQGPDLAKEEKIVLIEKLPGDVTLSKDQAEFLKYICTYKASEDDKLEALAFLQAAIKGAKK